VNGAERKRDTRFVTAHLLLPYPGGLPSSCLLKSRLKVTPRETSYHPYLPDNTSHQSINPFSMRMIAKEPARHSDPQGAMLCYVIRCIPQAEGRDHRNRIRFLWKRLSTQLATCCASYSNCYTGDGVEGRGQRMSSSGRTSSMSV
jgi:hypothetical protein